MHSHPSLQRKRTVDSSLPRRADTDLAGTLAQPSPGRPMEPRTRAWLEGGFGHDFANVQVHADGEADQLASAVHASAFTAGQDIYFREGEYNPDEPSGQHRLAHEAAHVVQQAAGPVAGELDPSGVSISHPDDAFERAAESAADGVMAGRQSAAAPTNNLAPTAAASLQRAEEDSLWEMASGLGGVASGLLGGLGGGGLGGFGGIAEAAGGVLNSGLGGIDLGKAIGGGGLELNLDDLW
jgi:hypothetical protein